MALTDDEIRRRDLARKHDNYEWAKARGLCTQCMKERAAKGRTMCLVCLSVSAERNAKCNAKLDEFTRNERKAKNREKMRNLYQERRKNGQCTRCGKPADGKSFCNECRLKRRRGYMERRTIKPEWQCKKCDEPSVDGYCFCEKHLKENRDLIAFARTRRKNNTVGDAINDFWTLAKAGGL